MDEFIYLNFHVWRFPGKVLARLHLSRLVWAFAAQAKKKNMRGSGYPTYSKFLPPTLNFFLQILKLGEKTRTKLFCSAILFKLQIFEKKYIWKNVYALEVKGLKQGYRRYIFKNKPFDTFPSRSEYSNKKKKYPTYLP